MKQELEDIINILFNKQKYKDELLNKYSDVLNDLKDIIGDDYNDMSILFYLINRHFLSWLDSDVDVSINEKDVLFRRSLFNLVKLIGPKLLGCTQVIENRIHVNNPSSNLKDRNIQLPNKPVIFVANHGFRDDVLATALAANRHAYFYCGSLPLFFNTIEGLAVALVGDILINRRNKLSKEVSIAKVSKIMSLGTDLIMFPEGGWNKKSEIFTNYLWKGVYDFSCNGKYDVVPIVHYVKDMEVINKKNIIHTIIDDPIPLYEMSEKDALLYLREILTSWQYKMAELYGNSTREEELKNFDNHDEKWKSCVESRMKGIPRYDSEIEKRSDFRPKNIILPEDVFEPIANIKNITPQNIKMILKAKEMVINRKNSDFQRLY